MQMKVRRRNLGGTEYTTSNTETNTKLLLWLCGVVTINCILTLTVLLGLWKH
jgi:hypothetical protein